MSLLTEKVYCRLWEECKQNLARVALALLTLIQNYIVVHILF